VAGLSRSEYLASQQKKKSGIGRLLWQIIVLAIMFVVFPMLVLFALPFVIGFSIIVGSLKDGIDLPEFR